MTVNVCGISIWGGENDPKLIVVRSFNIVTLLKTKKKKKN